VFSLLFKPLTNTWKKVREVMSRDLFIFNVAQRFECFVDQIQIIHASNARRNMPLDDLSFFLRNRSFS
jgi:hypothetical protein